MRIDRHSKARMRNRSLKREYQSLQRLNERRPRRAGLTSSDVERILSTPLD